MSRAKAQSPCLYVCFAAREITYLLTYPPTYFQDVTVLPSVYFQSGPVRSGPVLKMIINWQID